MIIAGISENEKSRTNADIPVSTEKTDFIVAYFFSVIK